MPYRVTPFINQSFYHIFNRGVNKQAIFLTDRNHQRFLETLQYYQFSGPKPRFSTHKRFKVKDFSNNPKIVEIICYCLMPNHFHILLRQLRDGGVSEFVSKVSNSYTKYLNTKHNRSGPLLQGEFKAVSIETDEQLLHVSRYIHLNPFVAQLVNKHADYKYSSYPTFTGLYNDNRCNPEPILEMIGGPEKYKDFVTGHEDYARELSQLKHLMHDLET